MGIGTLRRHHADTSQEAGTTPAPGAVPEAAPTSGVDALEAIKAEAKRWKERALEAEAKLEATSDESADETGEDSDDAQEAQEAAEEATGGEEGTQPPETTPEAATEPLSTAHGNVERPSATGSTAAWIAYAEADPNGAPFDLSPRTGLRDEIAGHYIKD